MHNVTLGEKINFATSQNCRIFALEMEHVINTPRQQVIMAFVATCIETTARAMGVDFSEVFERMKRLGMIEKYIYPNYETLHTESRENLAKDMIECMNRWEATK